jgi:hypothetical protein
MAASTVFQGCEQDGTVFDIGGNGSVINYTQDPDWAVTVDVSGIPKGQCSLERYWRVRFYGSYASISNVRCWRSDTNTLTTGVSVSGGGLTDGNGLAFATPTTTRNSDGVYPTSSGASNAAVNVDSVADGGGAVYAPPATGGNKFIRDQVKTSSTTPNGAISPGSPHFTRTISYSES